MVPKTKQQQNPSALINSLQNSKDRIAQSET